MSREDAGANIAEMRNNKRLPRGRRLSDEQPSGCDWYDDPDEVMAFARVMVEGDAFATPLDLLGYFVEPWKWTEDRDDWILAGEPDVFDPSEER